LRLSFGMAGLAALIDSVFGFIISWVLVRYRFPGKRLLDALIDLPFALPTAVAGIALSTLYAPNGWLGSLLVPLGIKIAYTPWGVLVAMTFIGLPFSVRSLQPLMAELGPELEEAAAMLGATRLQTLAKVVIPMLMPAILTGAAMSFARGVSEYGSIIFIAGNLPMVSEITPLLIVIKLEQFDYAGAAAIGVVMLAASFVMLLAINGLQAWAQSRR
jgi:sulfate/thiosulfate transport system permease protein